MLVGMSSILVMKFAAESREAGIRFKVNDVFLCRSIRELAKHTMSLGCWQSEDGRQKPIAVLIHGVTGYNQIQPMIEYLSENYFVYAIEPLQDPMPVFSDGEKTSEVVAFYTDYLDMVIPKDKEIALFAGHSYGGELAYRCAQRWKGIRGGSGEIMMLDTYADKERHFWERLTEDELKKISEQSGIDEVTLRERIKAYDIVSSLEDGSPFPSYDGKVTLMKALLPEAGIGSEEISSDFRRMTDANEEFWKNIVPQIKVIPVEADHYSIISKITGKQNL